MKEIDSNPENYLIIHYSCESFYGIEDGHSPRITSIAVYNFESAQTESFSIHRTAERMHISMEDISDHYDDLERNMLSDYFQFVKEHKGKKYIHWNMRDSSYGFKAIEFRYEVLGGSPEIINDSCKIDLARILIHKYGVNYSDHPRMEKLIELNNIGAKDYLTGQQEADAFENKEFYKLHKSTLRKVDVFANIINRSVQGSLKVKSKWYDAYGVSLQGIFEWLQSKWWYSVITLILGGVIGAIIDRIM